jgi:UDP-glucose 4-epimerase
MGRYLVTGGAGYIGSHMVLALADRGDEVVVFDNLLLGHREAVPAGVKLVVADLADAAAVDATLRDGKWDAVLHFASLSQVGESMRQPFEYLLKNGVNGIKLIEACVKFGVPKFVLSSTAALFAEPDEIPIPETATIRPGSPYGESKHILENTLLWAGRIYGLKSARIRYFNAAGADALGRAGEDHRPESHLIPLAIDAALGNAPPLTVFGTDYPTPDGTCIRDYVHVTDVADAHLRALDQLGDRSVVYNLGNGQGHSVLQVLQSIERVSGLKVPHSIGPRRAGDPAVLVASSAKLRAETGWNPKFADLDAIVATALAWRREHPKGY